MMGELANDSESPSFFGIQDNKIYFVEAPHENHSYQVAFCILPASLLTGVQSSDLARNLQLRALMKRQNTPTFLMSYPECHDHCTHSPENCEFQVAWQINPHMKVGKTNSALAKQQHRHLRQCLRAAGAQVQLVPFVHGAFDSVYIKDSAILRDGVRPRALLARPSHSVRQMEQERRAFALRQLGFQVEMACGPALEGGDVVVIPQTHAAFLGHGFRSRPSSLHGLEEFLEMEVHPLELVDPRFYHLDTALSIITAGSRKIAFALKEAFSEKSWKSFLHHSEIDEIVQVSHAEAMRFGLNWVEVNDHVILGSEVPMIQKALQSFGKIVIVCPLSEFQLGGGSAACLTARVHSHQQHDESWMSMRRDLNWSEPSPREHN